MQNNNRLLLESITISNLLYEYAIAFPIFVLGSTTWTDLYIHRNQLLLNILPKAQQKIQYIREYEKNRHITCLEDSVIE